MLEKPDYQKRLEEQAAEEKRGSRIAYNMTAFMLKRPYSDKIVKGPLRLSGRDDHRKLIEEAKQKKLYVWCGSIVQGEDKIFRLVLPHLIDWDSIPDKAYDYVAPEPSELSEPTPKIERYPTDLKCAKCGHQCSSASGYTLHMKAHERVEQARAEKYPDDLKCTICDHECSSTSGYTLHMKSHKNDQGGEEFVEAGDEGLKCPHCGKQCSSTSGLTLHVKHRHPGAGDE